MNERILLVEDEEGVRITLEDRLASENYQVETASDGEEGLQIASSRLFDLIILDIMLPGKSGFDVCRDLRQKGVETPILMLTARGELTDKVVGLKLGADDYLTKPFETLELLARVEALIRRSKTGFKKEQNDQSYESGNLRIDFRSAEVYHKGKRVDMSAKEYQLLKYFVENSGKVVSRDELLNQVWGYDALPSTRTVDVHVAWLRQKLEEKPNIPNLILTVHGIGYKYVG